MSNTHNPFSRPLRPSEIGMRGEILRKWSKFKLQEIEDLKCNDDLVTKVQFKYGLQRPQAQCEVENFAKGRKL